MIVLISILIILALFAGIGLYLHFSKNQEHRHDIERNQLERENEERIIRAKLEAERETGNQKRRESFVDHRER